MSYNELMIKSLSDLLKFDGANKEVLKYPIYGTLISKPQNHFGFFGLTEAYLLIALLRDDGKTIHWTARIPLEVKKVIVKRSMIPMQSLIDIEFIQGAPCRIRVSRRVHNIPAQEECVFAFIKCLEEKVNKESELNSTVV